MYITHWIPEVIEERETTKDTGLEGQIYPFPEPRNCPPGCGAPKPSLISPGVGKFIPGEKPGARQSLRVEGEGSGDTGNDSNSGGRKMRDLEKRQSRAASRRAAQGATPVCRGYLGLPSGQLSPRSIQPLPAHPSACGCVEGREQVHPGRGCPVSPAICTPLPDRPRQR